ncbi:cathepsin W isoform X1 [Ahaetulla prasina]|uniref:cathepsin W isoform X1 n=1 Tax=Ahaetulla prasina TaxID=499056 RepID=UPI002648AABC|nr:cathepsin W isoform X1 [Ahaetulla prasina]
MQRDAPAMWLAKLAACLMLWPAWISVLCANFTLSSDPGMTEMTRRFQEFMAKFGKTYTSQEDTIYRFKVFAQNMETSRVLQDTELGTAQYGITPFSDLTESEFAKRFGAPVLRPVPFGPTELRRAFVTTPRFCDWRKKGLSPVKDQGDCRSCWAFAAVSNIEALWKIHRNVNCSLSVQEIIDCTYHSRGGCLGGYVWDALQYVFNKSMWTSPFVAFFCCNVYVSLHNCSPLVGLRAVVAQPMLEHHNNPARWALCEQVREAEITGQRSWRSSSRNPPAQAGNPTPFQANGCSVSS